MIGDYWASIQNGLNALTDNEKDVLLVLIPILLAGIGWLIKTIVTHRQQKKIEAQKQAKPTIILPTIPKPTYAPT